MDSKLLYDNIKALALVKGVHMGDVEYKSGVQPGYISRVGRGGIQNVRLDVVLAYADALDVTVEDLVRKDFTEDIKEKARQKEIDALEKRLKELKDG